MHMRAETGFPVLKPWKFTGFVCVCVVVRMLVSIGVVRVYMWWAEVNLGCWDAHSASDHAGQHYIHSVT